MVDEKLAHQSPQTHAELSPAISKLPLKFISNVISQDIPNCKQ